MPDLLNLETWFDRLPEVRRREVLDVHSKLSVKEWLLPEDQGTWIDHQLEAAQQNFLARTGPFSFGRVGDCELALLGSGFLHERMPIPHLKPLDQQLFTAGLTRDGLKMRPEFIAALKRTTLMGVQQNWPDVRKTSAVLFALSGFEMPPPNAVDFHLLYRMLVNGSLFKWLAGKKVWMVGYTASMLADRWKNTTFIRDHKRFGPLEEIEVVGSFRTRPRGQGSWKDLDAATEAANKKTFDVALLACGAMAKILAVRIQDMGRIGLDAGFLVDALLGDSQRTTRAIIRDGWK